MDQDLIKQAKRELLRHDFSTFQEDIGDGRKITVAGCPLCKKRLLGMNQFLEHIANDVLEPMLVRILERDGMARD